MSSRRAAAPAAGSGAVAGGAAEVGESLALPPPRDAFLLAIAVLGVSASAPLTAAAAAPALAIAFWRNAIGAAVSLVPVGRRIATDGLRSVLPGARPVAVASLAGLFLALHFGTWLPSVKYTSVASSTALVATQSAFAGIIASALGRRMPRTAWLGIGLAFLGSALIAGADVQVSSRAVLGDGLAVIGGLAAAAYMTAGARARRELSVTAYTGVCYTVCALVMLVVCLIGGQPLGGYPARAWLLIASIAVCAQVLGHSLMNVVLRSVSPTFISLVILLETPGAGLIAWLWLGQTPPLSAVPGLVLLLAGLIVVVRSRPAADTVGIDID